MSQPVCPACENDLFELCEPVNVEEQHKLYAPGDEATQHVLTEAASKTALRYRMLRCKRCGLEFSDPMASPTAAWYQLVYRTLDLFSVDHWEYEEVISHVPEGAHVFEFECGSGNFLDRCQRRKRVVSGMDFSADAVASCVAKGLDVRQIDLNAIAPPSNSVSNIVAFHFVEHVERPIKLFEHAAARAMPLANLWLSVPSDRRSTRRFGVRDFLDQPPHHMTRWTPEAFRQIGKRHGWRLVETLYEPISLRVSVWSITVCAPRYREWAAAGYFKNGLFEKAYRAVMFPAALLRYLLSERQLSGFAMLAHFVFEG